MLQTLLGRKTMGRKCQNEQPQIDEIIKEISNFYSKKNGTFKKPLKQEIMNYL